MSDLCDKTATELRSLIGRKDISPVELVESCIERIETTDKALNAVVTPTFDHARNEAAQLRKLFSMGMILVCFMDCQSALKISRQQAVFLRHWDRSFTPIMFQKKTKDQSPIFAPRAAS